MLATDPAGALQHYPQSMARFGANPYGENLYRIVLASTRRHLCYGKWNEAGANRAKWVLSHPHLGGTWILEKWIDAFSFSGVTAAQWNADFDLTSAGPYPARGEYQMCGNTSFDPAQTNIEKLISLIEAGSKHSWAERLAACRDSAAKIEAANSADCKAIILDAYPAFGHAAFSQLSTGRGGAGKTSPIRYSANELGLPVPHGKPGQVTAGGSMMVPKRKRRKAA